MALEISKETLDKILNSSDQKMKEDLLRALLSAQSKPNVVVSVEEMVLKLKSSREEYTKETNFKAGDIVEWKPFMRNRNLPLYNQPAIVIEQLSNPLFDEKQSSGSHLFQEPLNLKLGIIIDNGYFQVFHYDKQRFKIFEKNGLYGQ